MSKQFVGVRDVDSRVFQKFKAKSVEEHLTIGEALTEAMKYWTLEHARRRKEKFRFPRVKPFSFGTGNERISEQVDEILYGDPHQ